jgi:hypothetical protein
MPDSTNNSSESDEDLKKKIMGFSWVALGLLIAAFLAIWLAQLSGVLAAIGICAIILLTAGAAGAVLGFLFALPRILTKDNPTAAAAGAGSHTEGSATPAGQRLLGSNTNLEKVSDWLTTIIVGVGLTQFSSLNDLLFRFREFIEKTAKVFPGDHNCVRSCSAGVLPTIAPMVLIFGLIMGFLLVYLYTRIIISGMLNKAEDELSRVQAELKTALPQPAADAVKTLLTALPGATENVAFAASSSGQTPSAAEGLELMGTLLYRPGGYQGVIDLAGKLVKTPAETQPEYWLYQAAAFGQKYTALKAHGASDSDLTAARENALNAARRAVKIDPLMRDRLWVISNPAGEDDDLKDLRSDPEFLKITGRSRESSP